MENYDYKNLILKLYKKDIEYFNSKNINIFDI